MDQHYMAKTLAEKVGVTYEEALKALEDCGFDMLDAAIKLEREQDSSNKEEATQNFKIRSDYAWTKRNSQSFDDWIKLIWRWIMWLINASVKNDFNVAHKGEVIVKIPILALIVLFMISASIILAIIIVGLFMGCKYYFSGPDFENDEAQG